MDFTEFIDMISKPNPSSVTVPSWMRLRYRKERKASYYKPDGKISLYTRHQGKKECARRLARMQKEVQI